MGGCVPTAAPVAAAAAVVVADTSDDVAANAGDGGVSAPPGVGVIATAGAVAMEGTACLTLETASGDEWDCAEVRGMAEEG